MEKTVEINYHKNQSLIFDDPVRFKVACCGRRFGKTLGAENWLVENVLEDKPREVSWWIEPIYAQSKRVFKEIKYKFASVIKRTNESDLIIEFYNKSIIEFKSADNPDNLKGDKPKRVVLDECATMKSEIWTEVIRPSLMDHKGDAVFIGTPKGQNWFADLYYQGEDPLNTEIKSFRFTTYDNPFINHEEVEKAKKEMPERLFRQEIMAEFVDDIGGVFRGVKECVKGAFEEPYPGEEYVMGVDLGKYEDFTVLCVVRKSAAHVVAFDRFNQINWGLQEQRILELANKYDAFVYMDQGQVGDAVLEELLKKWSRIKGIKFNNENKTEMINLLSNRIEKGEISYPEIPVLINELRIYQYEKLPSGKLRMNAPSGHHDDTVIALGLAIWQLSEFDFEGIMGDLVTETRSAF